MVRNLIISKVDGFAGVTVLLADAPGSLLDAFAVC
jgi:hypothetical protein